MAHLTLPSLFNRTHTRETDPAERHSGLLKKAASIHEGAALGREFFGTIHGLRISFNFAVAVRLEITS